MHPLAALGPFAICVTGDDVNLTLESLTDRLAFASAASEDINAVRRASGALEPVLEDWWQSFSGPFLYCPRCAPLLIF